MDIVINEVTFSLPVRSFLIDYSVSQHRQLPVVKEFVVRFIFSIERCMPEIIQVFFGFSTNELLVVLSDLEEEKLTQWDENNNVLLTNYAKQRFEQINGKSLPRFFEINDTIDSVSFELMGYRLIADSVVGENNPSNIEIQLNASNFENVTDKARTAFDNRFVEFLERIKKIDVFNEHHELYKINSVTSQHDRTLPLKVKFVLDLNDPTHPIPKYSDEWVDEWDDDRSIIGSIRQILEENANTVGPMEAAVQEYLKVSFDPVVSEFASDGTVNTEALFDSYKINKANFSSNGRMIIGNLYSIKNLQLINQLLDQSHNDQKLTAKGAIWSIWPDGKLWGRSVELQKFVESLNSRFDSRYRPGKIAMCLPTDSHYEARELSDIYYGTGALFQGVNIPFGNSQTEILLIPGTLVVTLIHLTREGFGNLTLPIGYASTDEKYIKAVEREVTSWGKDESNFNAYFPSSKQDKTNDLINKILG